VDPDQLTLGGPGPHELVVELTDRCGNHAQVRPVRLWKQSAAPAQPKLAAITLAREGLPSAIRLLPGGGSALAPVRLIATSADIVSVDQLGSSTKPCRRVTAGPSSLRVASGAGPVLWLLDSGVPDGQQVKVALVDAAGNRTAAAPITVSWVKSQFTYAASGVEPPSGTYTGRYGFWGYVSHSTETYSSSPWSTDGVPREAVDFVGIAHPYVTSLYGPGQWELIRTLQFQTAMNPYPVMGETIGYPRVVAGYAPIGQTLQDQPLEQQALRFEWDNDLYHSAGNTLGGPVGSYFLRSHAQPQVKTEAERYPPYPWEQSPVSVSIDYSSTVTYQVAGHATAPTDDLSNWVSWSPTTSSGVVRSVPPSWSADRSVSAPAAVSRRVPVALAVAGSASDLPSPSGAATASLTIPRDVPGGWSRLQWREEASATASDPLPSMDAAGFRGLNLVKLVPDVVVASAPTELRIEAGFLETSPAWTGAPSPPPAPSLDAVRFIDAGRESAMAALLAGEGGLAAVAGALLAEHAAIVPPAEGPGPDQRLLLLERDAVALAGLVSANLAALRSSITAWPHDLPERGIWDACLADALALLTQAQADEAAADAATDRSTPVLLHRVVGLRIAAVRSRLRAVERTRDGIAAYRKAGQDLIDAVDAQYRAPIAALHARIEATVPAFQSQRAAYEAAVSGFVDPATFRQYEPVGTLTIDPRVAGWAREGARLTGEYTTALSESPGPAMVSALLPTVSLPTTAQAASAVSDRTRLATDPENDALLTIESCRLDPGGIASALKQSLVVAVRPGTQTVGLYHVDVRYGVVKAYSDALSQTHAGASGAHRMKEAMKIIRCDVDVDLDNNDGNDPPSRSSAEEAVEVYTNDPTKAGKVFFVNNGDKDHDGLEDFADGYDLSDGRLSLESTSAGVKFVPVVVEIAGDLSPQAKIRVTYDASIPRDVQVTLVNPYLLPSGTLRLWKKNGDQARNGKPVKGQGGDFIKPDTYTLADLGFGASGGTQTWYMEAVRPIATTGALHLRVEVDPQGDGAFMGAIGPNVHPVAYEMWGRSRDDAQMARVSRLQASQLTKNDPPLAEGATIPIGLVPISTTRVPSLLPQADGSTILRGGGLGLGTLGDQQEFDAATLWSGSVFGASTVQAQVTALAGTAQPMGGVIFRASTEAGAPFVALARVGTQVRLLSRTLWGGGLASQDVTGAGDSLLRLERTAGVVTWRVGASAGTVALPLEGWATVGWFVVSGDATSDGHATLANRALTFTTLPYPANALTPSNYLVHQVRVQDPRDLNAPHITIGGQRIVLHRDDALKALVSEPFVAATEQPTGDLIPNEFPVVAFSEGAVQVQYNPEEDDIFFGAKEITEADKKVGEAIKEVVEDMKASGWTSGSGSIDGTTYTGNDDGAFGKEVHKRVAARFQGKPGWVAELYVDDITLKLHDRPLPPGQQGRTNLDLMKLKDGYMPQVGDILDQSQIEEIYEIKTSLKGKVEQGQLNRLKRAKGGDIKVVNSKFRWTTAKGWHLSPKFGRYVRVLSIIGLAASPVVFVLGSEGDEKLKEVTAKAVEIKQLSEAGEIDFFDKRLHLIDLNRLMKEYFDSVTGGNPVTDLAFLGGLYKIIGLNEFNRVEGEDP
jgi:hypothetical protein